MVAKKEWCGIFRGGGIGDDIVTTSPLPLLRAKYGHVEFITHGPQAVIYENNPYIDKLTVLPDNKPLHSSATEWQKWFSERAIEYAFFANLSHTVEARLALLTGQTDFYRPASWRRKHCGMSYLENTHDACDVPYDFTIGPRFYPTDAEKADARRLKGEMGGVNIGFVLGGTRIDKMHPRSAMIVARLLREIPDSSVVMFGAGQRDFEIAKQIDKHVVDSNSDHDRLHLALSAGKGEPETPLSAADAKRQDGQRDTQWPLRRSLTQAQHCDLLISPDSGLAWACAMEAMPKVMLLSHASGENITKHWRNTVSLSADPAVVKCFPCHQLHDEPSTCTANSDNTGAACITDISVERIMRTVKGLLERRPVMAEAAN